MSSNSETLEELFAGLQSPAMTGGETNRYMALPIRSSGTYRLGKDSAGAPALLIQLPSDQATDSSPIRLRHLYVAHDVALCQGRRENVPAGRSKTVPLNATL